MDPELNHDIAETPSEEEIESLKDEKSPKGQDYSEEIVTLLKYHFTL